MPLLSAGTIEHEVEVTVSCESLTCIENCGEVLLPESARQGLRELAFTWTERRDMARPDYSTVIKILNRLIRLSKRKETDELLLLTEKLASACEDTAPSQAYVYDRMVDAFKIPFHAAWRDRIRSGRVGLSEVLTQLLRIRKNLKDVYGNKKGRTRDHDLGWVIPSLAVIYHSAGGRISASSRFNYQAKHNEPSWIDTSKFIRFARAFVAVLPKNGHARRTRVGRLIRILMPKLRALIGA
jgi:hypothetical protein